MNLKDKLLDKLDVIVDKFEQFYYTRVARPSENYDEELLNEITNELISNCSDNINITGYNDYLIIHFTGSGYGCKVSYESAEKLRDNLTDVLEWRKE